MKNKERIEMLEKRVEVLENLVRILQMKTTPRVPPTPAPAPMPTTWPSYPKVTPSPWPGFNPNIQPYTVTCGNTVH